MGATAVDSNESSALREGLLILIFGPAPLSVRKNERNERKGREPDDDVDHVTSFSSLDVLYFRFQWWTGPRVDNHSEALAGVVLVRLKSESHILR